MLCFIREEKMSRKDAEDFIKKMNGDELFSEKVISIIDVRKRIKYIKQKGFVFTGDELYNAWMSKSKQNPKQLSDV